MARYYSSAQGRFTSPDEFTGGPDELYYFADDASSNPIFYADLFNPQSMNKYQYSYNNPLRYVDPDGHQQRDKTGNPSAQGPAVPYSAPSDVNKFLADRTHEALMATGDAIINTKGGYRFLSRIANFINKHNTTDGIRAEDVDGVEPETAKEQAAQPQEGQSSNYQPNPKHDDPHGDDRRGVSPQPQAGDSLFASAIQVKSGQRVAVDRSSGKFVVYRTDPNGQTHGYETSWQGLRNDQRTALQKAGLVTQRGKIVPPKQEQ